MGCLCRVTRPKIRILLVYHTKGTRVIRISAADRQHKLDMKATLSKFATI